MLGLRRAFLSLLAYLAVLLVFEYQRQDTVSFSGITVVLAFIVMVSVLAIPFLSRQKPLYLVVIFLLAYFIARLLTSPSSVWGGIHTYITLVECFLLIVAVLLAADVGTKLNDFNDAVRNITLGELDYSTRDLDQLEVSIEREFLRSARHQYPLSVIIVRPDEDEISLDLNQAVAEIQRSMMGRYALNAIVRITSTLLRRTDLIVEQISHQNSFVVFCPDTSHENAKKLIERLKLEIKTQTGIGILCGYATYPLDGHNFEDLVEFAGAQLQSENIGSQPEGEEKYKENSYGNPI